MTAEVEAPPAQQGKIGALVDGYIKLRDKKAEIKAKHDAELAPINETLAKIEIHLLEQMQAQGVKAYKADSGTAYTSTSTSATVADRDMFFKFVREKELWQFLEARVSKTAVDEYVAANEEVPPGVNYKTAVVVNVRRS